MTTSFLSPAKGTETQVKSAFSWIKKTSCLVYTFFHLYYASAPRTLYCPTTQIRAPPVAYSCYLPKKKSRRHKKNRGLGDSTSARTPALLSQPSLPSDVCRLLFTNQHDLRSHRNPKSFSHQCLLKAFKFLETASIVTKTNPPPLKPSGSLS